MSRWKFERASTRLSPDGTTVFVQLRVEREAYEFARHWAAFHAAAAPDGTAEDQLEGYLNMALTEAMEAADWTPPPEIEALRPKARPRKPRAGDLDDDIPI